MRLTLLAAAGAASLALAAPAAAQTTEPLPTAQYWFGCSGPTKVETAAPAWGTTKPAASFTGGAGCGFLDPGPQPGASAPNGSPLDFRGTGKHTGPIQSLTVELHSLLTGRARAVPDIPGIWELTIDGQQVALVDAEQRIAPVTSPTGASESYTFTFVRRKPAGKPAPPLAAGTGEHTVGVRFTSRTVEYQHTWVWGATEVPAGVTINPEKPASTVIVA